jgi:hypothetical protein
MFDRVANSEGGWIHPFGIRPLGFATKTYARETFLIKSMAVPTTGLVTIIEIIEFFGASILICSTEYHRVSPTVIGVVAKFQSAPRVVVARKLQGREGHCPSSRIGFNSIQFVKRFPAQEAKQSFDQGVQLIRLPNAHPIIYSPKKTESLGIEAHIPHTFACI